MKTLSAAFLLIAIIKLPSPNVPIAFLPVEGETSCFPDLGRNWVVQKLYSFWLCIIYQASFNLHFLIIREAERLYQTPFQKTLLR